MKKRGVGIVTAFIISIKKTFLNSSSPFSLYPTTDYQRHVPKSAEQLMHNNWLKTGDSLSKAMEKVGEEIGK